MPIELRNPYDQSVIAEVNSHSNKEVDMKLNAAQVAFEQWSKLPLAERIAEVSKGVEKLLANQDEIARQISLQMGKPINEAYGELTTFKQRAEYCLAVAEEALAPDELTDQAGFIRRIEHVPHGVVLDIAAWNYPLIIPANVIIPGLLAGNVILLKHSEQTLLCGQQLAQAFSGLAVENLVTNLVIDHQQCERLLQDRRIAHVVFTGSVRGGQAVYQATAREHFRDITLELGGKDPAYVASDADLAFAAENIVSGALYNAGQSCCAVERVVSVLFQHDAHAALSLVYCACDERMVINSASEGIE